MERGRGRLAWVVLVLSLSACAARSSVPPRTSPREPLSAEQIARLHGEADRELRRAPFRREAAARLTERFAAAITPSASEFQLIYDYVALQDRAGKAEAAERQVAAWRDSTVDAAAESVLSLWLAQRAARAGSLASAAAEVRRHIRTGERVDATSYVWAGSIALGQAQLEGAARFFLQALALGDDRRHGLATPRALAQAGFGLALVRDLEGNLLLVDEALSVATLYDGGDALARAACDGQLDLPTWGEAEAHYLCALIQARLGPVRGRADAPTFAAIEETRLPLAWQGRARHWRQQQAPPPRATTGSLRLLAVLTTRTDGPWPAPLIDVSWRRRDAFRSCLGIAPTAGTQRLAFRLRITLEGKVEEAAALDPPVAWGDVAECFAGRLAALLTLPPAPPMPEPGATLAIVEVLLTSP